MEYNYGVFKIQINLQKYNIFTSIYYMSNLIQEPITIQPTTIYDKIIFGIHTLVETIVSPRTLLTFNFNPFGLQTAIKTALLLVLFCIISWLIYYGSVNIMNNPNPDATTNLTATPNDDPYYIVQQYNEFINSTYTLFGYIREPDPVVEPEPGPEEPEPVSAEAMQLQSMNFNIIILQILGWILLIFIVIIISKMTDHYWFKS